MSRRKCVLAALLLAVAAFGLCAGAEERASKDDVIEPPEDRETIPDPDEVGGEDGSVVHVASLIYAGVKTSKCFSDHFLARAEKESAISTSTRFHSVKASSEDVFQYPFVIMTGEGAFDLTERERENLQKYCENGGLVLASAGCSSKKWDRSFRREIGKIWPDTELTPIGQDHPVYHTVRDIRRLRAKHGTPNPLEGISVDGKLAVIYSEDGLNDTAHTHGCCCCGGNEILNAEEVNMNILAYALIF